jgi:hypothetical protein
MRQDRYTVEQWVKYPMGWAWSIVYTSDSLLEALREWQSASEFGRQVRLTDTQSKD